MKILYSFAWLCASAGAAFAADYTLSANTTTTAQGLETAGWLVSGNNLFLSNGSRVVLDGSQPDKAYVGTYLYTDDTASAATSSLCAAVDISAGTLSLNRFQLGRIQDSAGVINLSGTGVLLCTNAANVNIAAQSGSTGIVNVSGTAQFIVGTRSGQNFYVGTATNSVGTLSVTGGGVSISRIATALGNTKNATGIISVSGGTLSILSGARIGNLGTGSFIISGGEATLSSTTTLGMYTNSYGSLSVSGGVLNLGSLMVGGGYSPDTAFTTGNVGVVTISAGDVVATGQFTLGTGKNSRGDLTMTGGTLTTSGLRLACSTNASTVLSLSGDAVLTTSFIQVNRSASGGITTISMANNAVLDMSQVSSSTLWTGMSADSTTSIALDDNAIIYIGSTSLLSQQANTVATLSLKGNSFYSVGDSLTGAAGASSSIAIEVAGDMAAVGVGNKLVLASGADSSANVLISSGSFSVGSDATISSGSGSSTVFTMTGGSFDSSGLRLAVGTNSTTTMNLSGDASVLATFVQLARAAGSSASITLSDNAQLSSGANGDFLMGNTAGVRTSVAISGNASLTTDGTRNLNIAANANNVATLSMTGGTLGVGNGLFVGGGVTSSGLLRISGGTATTGGVVYLGNSSGASGTISLTGGALNVGTWLTLGASTASSGVMEVDGGTLTVGESITIARVDATHSGNTGLLTVKSGTVSAVNGIFVNAGGTLAVHSGASVGGAVVLTGDLNLSVSGSTDAGANAVMLDNLTVAEGAEIAINLASFDITGESSVTLLTLKTAGTTLENAIVTVSGYDNTLWWVTTAWNADNTALLATIQVPEPAASACLLGLLGLALAARRRK